MDEESFTMFHMRQYEARQGEFKNWDDEKRTRVISRLIDIVKSRVSIGVASAVIKSDYDTIITGEVKEKCGTTHYSFCVQDCLRHVVNWADIHAVSGLIRYVFEDGARGKGDVIKLFNNIRKDNRFRARYRAGECKFEDKRVALPLQAADLLTYEMRKHMVNCVLPNQEERRKIRLSFESMVKSPLVSNYFDEQNLTELKDVIESNAQPKEAI